MLNKTEKDIMKNWTGNTLVPIVSISCTIYNHEKYIAMALDSFLSQETDFPFEIIAGEDCSTDTTRAIILEYQAKYPNIIKPILWEQNVGAYKNWITILQTCQGQFIANCEGDDYWTDPEKLQIQKDFLDKNDDFAMCTHAVEIIDNTENTSSYIPYSTNIKSVNTFNDILKYHFIPTLSLLFRNCDLPKPFPAFLKNIRSGDIALELILASQGKCYYDFKKMGVYRHHDGGITKQDILTFEDRMKKEYILYNGINEYLNFNKEQVIKKKLARLEYMYGRVYLNNKDYKKAVEMFIRMFKNDFLFIFKRIFIKYGIIK